MNLQKKNHINLNQPIFKQQSPTQHKQNIIHQSINQLINQLSYFIKLQTMRPQNTLNISYHQQQVPQQENQQLHYEGKTEAQQEIARLKKVIIALIVFILIVAGLGIYHQFHNNQTLNDGKFYQDELLGYELDDFWKMTAEEQQEEQADPDKKIILKGQHVISRKQLGHNSWSLLHMVTGSFPEEINDVLVKKFNVFLNLFGQMYPCKMCANHFMTLLKEVGQFTGTTKLELMTYLCNIHNRVNQRLGKPEHSCQNIVQEWNTCGCSGR